MKVYRVYIYVYKIKFDFIKFHVAYTILKLLKKFFITKVCKRQFNEIDSPVRFQKKFYHSKIEAEN